MFKIKKYYPEVVGGLLCLTFGMLSGYSVKISDSLWYISLRKPIFNPPSWIFGPVWTILYLMMGIAFGLLWKVKNRRLIFIFVIQLIFNLLWSTIFFHYQSVGWALLDICALWLSLIVLMFVVRNRRSVLFLLVPYFLWITFALMLNFSIYQMNKV